MNEFILKNNVVTADIRCDRIVKFDERSRAFPIIKLVSKHKKLRSYTWRCREWLDQKNEGACVSTGIGHELAARPAEVKGLTFKYVKENIYWPAQESDDWPGGSYPNAHPYYEGTSVLAGIKIAHKMGWFDSFHWAFGLRDLQIGVGYHGPAVLGLRWYTGMYAPDSDGYIHPTGKIVGGHCILCNAINVKKERFTLHNSWGRGWGRDGECYISFGDMTKLLYQQGEAAFFKGRHTVAISV